MIHCSRTSVLVQIQNRNVALDRFSVDCGSVPDPRSCRTEQTERKAATGSIGTSPTVVSTNNNVGVGSVLLRPNNLAPRPQNNRPQQRDPEALRGRDLGSKKDPVQHRCRRGKAKLAERGK